MANTGVKVTISAADRASQTIERINNRIAQMQAPVRRVQAAFGRFASLSGMSRLNNGITGVGRAATSAFRSLGQIVPVLGTITGATSLAGVYRLASAWSQVGTSLRTTSRVMGIAPQRLQAMQNAAKLAGGSAESMSGALQQLAQERWAAVHNQDPAAAARFRALQISPEDVQTQPIDKLFQLVGSRIRALRNPTAQAIAAQERFGGNAQGLIPIFQQTNEQWERTIQQAERYSHMTRGSVEAANSLRRSQAALGESVEDFGNSISEAAAPGVQKLTEFITGLIDANRAWIAQDIGEYVRQFVTWMRTTGWKQIKTDITGVQQAITNVVDRLGGWQAAGKTALIAIGGLYAMPVLAGLASVATAMVTIAGAVTAISWPVALAVAAIAALGVAGYELWSHWGTVSKKFSDMWSGLKNIFQNNTGYVRTLTETLFPLPSMIVNHWGHLGKFFTDLWDGIRGAFSSAWSYISPIVDKMRSAIDFVANSWVGKKMAAAANMVERGAATGARTIGSYARQGMDWYAQYADRMTGYRTPQLDAPVQAAGIAAAQRYGLDQSHYLALLRKEHGGYNNVSKAGAFGPGQLMPATARWLGVADSINAPSYDWRKNLDASARYYRQLLDRAGGDYAVADASYNAGPNSRAVSRFAQTHDISALPKETQDYVLSIARGSRADTPGVPGISVPIFSSGGAASSGTGARDKPLVVQLEAAPGTRGRVKDAPDGTKIVNRIPVQRSMHPDLAPVGN
jgi:hypothetical protein